MAKFYFVMGVLVGILCAWLSFILFSSDSSSKTPLADSRTAQIKSNEQKFAGLKSPAAEIKVPMKVDLSSDPAVVADVLSTEPKRLVGLSLNGQDLNAFLYENPEYAKILALKNRRTVERQWLPVLKSKNLSEESVNHVINVLTERASLEAKYKDEAARTGVIVDPKDEQKYISENAKRLTEELESSFGSEEFAKMQRMAVRSDLIANVLERDLIPDLRRGASPLNDRQYQLLTASLLVNYQDVVKGSALRAGGPIPSDDTLFREAAAYLSVSQVETLKQSISVRRQLQMITEDALAKARSVDSSSPLR